MTPREIPYLQGLLEETVGSVPIAGQGVLRAADAITALIQGRPYGEVKADYEGQLQQWEEDNPYSAWAGYGAGAIGGSIATSAALPSKIAAAVLANPIKSAVLGSAAEEGLRGLGTESPIESGLRGATTGMLGYSAAKGVQRAAAPTARLIASTIGIGNTPTGEALSQRVAQEIVERGGIEADDVVRTLSVMDDAAKKGAPLSFLEASTIDPNDIEFGGAVRESGLTNMMKHFGRVRPETMETVNKLAIDAKKQARNSAKTLINGIGTVSDPSEIGERIARQSGEIVGDINKGINKFASPYYKAALNVDFNDETESGFKEIFKDSPFLKGYLNTAKKTSALKGEGEYSPKMMHEIYKAVKEDLSPSYGTNNDFAYFKRKDLEDLEGLLYESAPKLTQADEVFKSMKSQYSDVLEGTIGQLSERMSKYGTSVKNASNIIKTLYKKTPAEMKRELELLPKELKNDVLASSLMWQALDTTKSNNIAYNLIKKESDEMRMIELFGEGANDLIDGFNYLAVKKPLADKLTQGSATAGLSEQTARGSAIGRIGQSIGGVLSVPFEAVANASKRAQLPPSVTEEAARRLYKQGGEGSLGADILNYLQKRNQSNVNTVIGGVGTSGAINTFGNQSIREER